MAEDPDGLLINGDNSSLSSDGESVLSGADTPNPMSPPPHTNVAASGAGGITLRLCFLCFVSG
jgi:hypothetical protein